jgi:hypothetical protein
VLAVVVLGLSVVVVELEELRDERIAVARREAMASGERGMRLLCPATLNGTLMVRLSGNSPSSLESSSSSSSKS